MTASEDPTDDLLDPDDSPIAELQALLDGCGEEVARGFGAARTIYAGALAGTNTDNEKLADLKAMPLECPKIVPKYVGDYVSLNRFVA